MYNFFACATSVILVAQILITYIFIILYICAVIFASRPFIFFGKLKVQKDC